MVTSVRLDGRRFDAEVPQQRLYFRLLDAPSQLVAGRRPLVAGRRQSVVEPCRRVVDVVRTGRVRRVGDGAETRPASP